jgi:tripartite-type tricarboxylate transporter receptor subunit TctC
MKTLFCPLLRGALVALAVAASATVQAQDHFPSGPITLMVPNPPGGASDISARILADPWASVLKQPVVIVNRPGMGGAIGTAQSARAKPDGQNVLLALSVIAVAPEAERVSGRKALYEVDQFEPIALLSSESMVMLVRADSPWKTLDDMIAAAKAKPNAINYASSGNFGPIHLSVAMLANKAGIQLTQVPFAGGGPAVLAVLAGQVDMTTAAPSVAAAQITAGKLRPLAVSGNRRSEMMPEVKTYRELGYDVEYTVWAGLYVPKGTPTSTLQVLRESVAKTVQTPEFKGAMQKNGIAIDYRDAPAFSEYAAEDGKRMVEAVRAIGKVD